MFLLSITELPEASENYLLIIEDMRQYLQFTYTKNQLILSANRGKASWDQFVIPFAFKTEKLAPPPARKSAPPVVREELSQLIAARIPALAQRYSDILRKAAG